MYSLIPSFPFEARNSCLYTCRISLCSLLCLAAVVAIFTILFPFPLANEIGTSFEGGQDRGCMRLSCRAAWKTYDSRLRLQLISTSSLVAMAEGSEEGKSKEKKQSILSFFSPRKTTAPKPLDEEKVYIAGDDHSGDAPKVPKLQTHTSDTTSSRDKGPPMPELKKHQTDMGEHGAGEPPREAYVMRVLKVQQS